MENISEEKKVNNQQIKTESVASVPIVSNSVVSEIKEKVPPVLKENVEEQPKNASEILDEEEKELPEPQNSEVKFQSSKPNSLSKPKTKKCPKGCIKKSRCKGPIRGGKTGKKNKKQGQNKSKKNKVKKNKK
jgi:hypothetical protein